MRTKFSKLISLLLCLVMVVGLLPTVAFAAQERNYPGYSFEKISNPDTRSGEPDGLNTNDTTEDAEFGPNRLNSYAWAMATRGDSIYIGTNRTLFGSALNTLAASVNESSDSAEELDPELLGTIIELISGGDVPVNLENEKDYIPQIIRFNMETKSTKVIYEIPTEEGTDGKLYYTDKYGTIIEDAVVDSETASFRSVVELNGNLYFGTLGAHMLKLVRIDKDDTATVVFETSAPLSSLRAGCVHPYYGEGDYNGKDTIYFGGLDSTLEDWSSTEGTLPIVIRCLNPETAGTDDEDWGRNNIVADYRDFGEYAKATVYANGGGTVWDLCSYNDKLYLILAHDDGWVMFRGEPADADTEGVNTHGWKWTEIVGKGSNNGNAPAMDPAVAEKNQEFADNFNATEYSALIQTTGLLESTATPYVFKGKMYIGSFDNATAIQSETVAKYLAKLQRLTQLKDVKTPEDVKNIDLGPSLADIYGPIYEVLSNPQHMWVMDEDEEIAEVNSANELLADSTSDYVWRFAEHDGKLYAGTFDSSTCYNYFLNFPIKEVLRELFSYDTPTPIEGMSMGSAPAVEPTPIEEMMDGTYEDRFNLEEGSSSGEKTNRGTAENFTQLMLEAAKASHTVYAFLNGTAPVEYLLPRMEALQNAREQVDGENLSQPQQQMISSVDLLLGIFDVKGLRYWAKAREIVNNATGGFDLLVSEDGENWSRILDNGFDDPYNYGARTFTEYNGGLYIGTANPYYGAQLWKMSVTDTYTITATAGEGGTISPKGSITVSAGDSQTFTITPDRGYRIKDIIVNGKSEGALSRYTFETVDSDAKIHAVFVKDKSGTSGKKDTPTYSITIEEAENGFIAASHKYAYKGTDITVTPTPDNGYELDTLTVLDKDGKEIKLTEKNGKYTFKMPASKVTVKATFKKIVAVNPFVDVKNGDYFYDAVLWAVEKDITSGTSATTFSPNEPCTRAQIVTFLFRAMAE